MRASLKLDHSSDGLQARFVFSIEDLFVPSKGESREPGYTSPG
jgi:hypothetical protein